jgi:hypothetical protein
MAKRWPLYVKVSVRVLRLHFPSPQTGQVFPSDNGAFIGFLLRWRPAVNVFGGVSQVGRVSRAEMMGTLRKNDECGMIGGKGEEGCRL